MLVAPLFPKACSPTVGSSSSKVGKRGTSLKGSSVGDGGGGGVWYHSSGSSSFFLPFQRFFILNQARSNVEVPVVLPATLAVSLLVSVSLVVLNSLKAW